VAYNVHWVHEAPELTAGQRGVSTANNTPAPFTACGGKAAQSGRRMNPLLSDRALLNQRDLVAERYPKDRLPARGAAAQAAALEPSAVTLHGLPGHGRPLVHQAAAQRRQPLPTFRLRMSDNVSWVHEAPELTARSARRFHRQQPTCTFHSLRWQGRASGRRMNPMLSDRALLKQRDLVAWPFPKDRLAARGAAAQSGGIGTERWHLARAARSRTPAGSSRRRSAAAAVTIIPFAHV
jgi:hypothetical protein